MDGKNVYINQSEILGYKKVPDNKNKLRVLVSYFFKILTILVMVGLILHILLDSYSFYRRKKKYESKKV